VGEENRTIKALSILADLETVASPAPTQSGLRFVARQPILTADEQVFGYELLFRDSLENYFSAPDADGAACSTLDSSLLMGLDTLCNGRYGFMNFTHDVLLRDYALLFPADHTVVEVLETVTPDAAVISACKRLKEAGYLIALDDFDYQDPREPLLDVADIIKVDVRATGPMRCEDIVRRMGGKLHMLAEKVETREEFAAARKMGFTYFQGYFFRVPEIVSTQDIPANKVNYLRMLQAVQEPDLDLRKIEDLIKSEVSLCYRLLRYLNSAVFSFRNEIRSIRHALTMLGGREIRRWVQLVAALGAAQHKGRETVFNALVRARFCELLGAKVPHGGSDLFLMGLFSLMDSILQTPMSNVIDKIPIEHAIKDVILGHPSHLRPIYRLMLAQESGEWPDAAELCKLLHLSTEEAADAYWKAVQWTRGVTAGM
jgi:EAL and modified HD-GYP domain-containing signal transduction protein